METRRFAVPPGVAGERLDVALSRILGFTRTFAADIIDEGGVTSSRGPMAKSDRVVEGDALEVVWKPKAEPVVVPVELPSLSIVFQDDDIVVVDKPMGVTAHPSVGWDGPTVLGALAASGIRTSTSGSAERAGIVHRLDAGTSGLMVVAKSERAYAELKRAFHDREVDKVYHAVVQGHPDPLAGTIEAPIGRHPGARWKFAVTRDGRPSVTHYETLEAFPGASLLEVRLETGRTHQIRVHFATQRHPCVGDELYGADPRLSSHLGLNRQWLHATRLGFRHPGTGEDVEFRSDYPADLDH
ncbi:MAG: RluA family pseudouridine synthase, partial [Cryobacterium sp.]|nr:RluA family pseudouridine synthase [Cryobacterium sp.]